MHILSYANENGYILLILRAFLDLNLLNFHFFVAVVWFWDRNLFVENENEVYLFREIFSISFFLSNWPVCSLYVRILNKFKCKEFVVLILLFLGVIGVIKIYWIVYLIEEFYFNIFSIYFSF